MSELEVWNKMGNIYYKAGSIDEAIRSYQKVIEINPGCGQSYSHLACILVGQGRYAEAIPMLQKGIERMDNALIKAFLWDQLGDIYRKFDDLLNACTSYRKAVSLDPNDANFAKKLAEVERAVRNQASGYMIATNQGDLSSIEFSRPDIGSPSISDRGSTKEKEETMDSVEVLNPHDSGLPIGLPEAYQTIEANPQAVLRLGLLHHRKGEYGRAIQFIRIAQRMAERSHDQFHQALANYALGQVETKLGKFEEAIQLYKNAASLAPDKIFPSNKIGDLYLMLARYEDARAAFQEAISHSPNDPAGWNGLGNVYHKTGRYEDAIASYQHGNVCENQFHEEDVLRAFEKSISSDQEKPSVWNEAGNIYFATDAFSDAIASYRKAIELDPANATFQTNLAKAEKARENAKSGNPFPVPEKSSGIQYHALTHVEPFIKEDISQEDVDTYNAQSLSAETGHALESKFVPERDSTSTYETIHRDPEAAFWMTNPVASHPDAKQPAESYENSNSHSIEDTAKYLPAAALQAQLEQRLASNQMLTETDYDRARVFVQLPPHPIKPVWAAETSNLPTTAGSRTAPSSPHPPTTGNQGTGQPSSSLNVFEKDITAARRVTDLNPKNDRAWDMLGNKYESAGLHVQAIAAFEQAITLDSQKEVYYYHLGIALAYQKEYEKAIQVLQKAISLNPDFMLAHCALSGYYRRLGKEAEAQEHMLIARPSIENENEYNRACFESICGNADQAIALLEIALEKQQINPEIVRTDPDLDFIRNDPRFEFLLYKNRIIDI